MIMIIILERNIRRISKPKIILLFYFPSEITDSDDGLIRYLTLSYWTTKCVTCVYVLQLYTSDISVLLQSRKDKFSKTLSHCNKKINNKKTKQT